MRNKIGKSLFLLINLLIIGCSKEEVKTNADEPQPNAEERCVNKRIEVNETYAFEYQYGDSGLFLVNEERFFSQSNSTSYYVKQIRPDSITLERALEDGTNELPTMTAKYNGENITELRRYYFDTGGINIIKFEYSPEKVRIDLDYQIGDRIQKISYGDYFLNEKGNVVEVKKYRYDTNDQSIVALYEERSFTYDNAINPWKGIFYPVFLCQSLPRAKFVSTNNIVTETKDSETFGFDYVYDESNSTVTGKVFEYISCSSDMVVTEKYTSEDCNF